MQLSRPHVSSRPLCSELVGRALCLSLSLHLSPAANLAASWLCSHAQTERSRTDLSHTHQAALVYFKPQTVWIQDVPGIRYGMWQAVWPEQKNQSVVWLPVFFVFFFAVDSFCLLCLTVGKGVLDLRWQAVYVFEWVYVKACQRKRKQDDCGSATSLLLHWTQRWPGQKGESRLPPSL